MKQKTIFITASLIVLCCLYAFFFIKKNEIPYNLNEPSSVITLPQTLHEVSGLTDFSNTEIACVQDEKGIIFIYDF